MGLLYFIPSIGKNQTAIKQLAGRYLQEPGKQETKKEGRILLFCLPFLNYRKKF